MEQENIKTNRICELISKSRLFTNAPGMKAMICVVKLHQDQKARNPRSHSSKVATILAPGPGVRGPGRLPPRPCAQPVNQVPAGPRRGAPQQPPAAGPPPAKLQLPSHGELRAPRPGAGPSGAGAAAARQAPGRLAHLSGGAALRRCRLLPVSAAGSDLWNHHTSPGRCCSAAAPPSPQPPLFVPPRSATASAARLGRPTGGHYALPLSRSPASPFSLRPPLPSPPRRRRRRHRRRRLLLRAPLAFIESKQASWRRPRPQPPSARPPPPFQHPGCPLAAAAGRDHSAPRGSLPHALPSPAPPRRGKNPSKRLSAFQIPVIMPLMQDLMPVMQDLMLQVMKPHLKWT
ncbi:uncharacterized protein LOC129149547 [Eptesicus fuscus]|uniref:uncharacterized protein LOC129149547 n=1 Tax=Eptesicus fuscus TaxID=29078 RepID=UPI00240468E7|nr:uncharacterized protein LOC129149547 [Eptesicus fuscus]